MSKRELNNEVTVFLDGLMHPRREEIDYLRKIIYDILVWKENDRAVATLKNLEEILKNSTLLKEIVTKWIEAAK